MVDTNKVKSFIENLTREEGILCNTSKNADKIIFTAMELGYTWRNKDRADTQWNVYKERTCYFFNPEDKGLSYSSKEYAEKEKLIFHTLDMFKSVSLVKLMNTVEQIKNTLKNNKYYWNVDEVQITEKQKIKLITDGQLKLKFIEDDKDVPNLIILYTNDSLWLYDKYSPVKYVFRADKNNGDINIYHNQYDLNDYDFENLIELLNKVESLFNEQFEKLKYHQAREFSHTIKAYNDLM